MVLNLLDAVLELVAIGEYRDGKDEIISTFVVIVVVWPVHDLLEHKPPTIYYGVLMYVALKIGLVGRVALICMRRGCA